MLLKVVSTGSKSGNSYVLTADNGEMLVLDAGSRYRDILKVIGYKISNVSGLLLTHEHGDHIECYKKFLDSGVKVYGCPELKTKIKADFNDDIESLEEKKSYSIGSFKAIPFYLPHDNVPNFGYLIDLPNDSGRLLYATDFSYIPYSFTKWNINFFLIECNHLENLADRMEAKYQHSLKGHSELQTVKKIIKVNKTHSLRSVVLCHLSDGWSDEKIMTEEIQQVAGQNVNVAVAHAGDEYTLSKYPF